MIKGMKKEYKMWVLCNRKEITIEDFKKIVGISFHQFFEDNKKQCLVAWREDISLRNPKKLKPNVPKIGAIPCQYSRLGLKDLRPKGGQRKGLIIVKSRDGKCLKVKWNKNISSYTYHPDFIEIL